MKLTLAEIRNLIEPLNEILEKDISWGLSYKFMEIADAVEEHNARYQKLHREMVQKYGEPVLDEKGNDTGQIQVKPENNDTFAKEHRKLLDQEVELSAPIVTKDEIENEDRSNIKPRLLYRLRAFIQRESPTEG